MKKTLLVAGVLISSLAMAQSYIVEPRLGFDAVGNSSTGSKVDKNFVKRGGELAVEGRTEVFENFEAGFGVAFVTKNTKKALSDKVKNLKELGYNFESKEKSFTSVPLYVTGKYKFDEVYGVKPYVKGKLGYAFNSMSASEKVMGGKKGFEIKKEAKNGTYLGLGAGVDYKNWTVDLSYNLNQFKVKDTVVLYGENEKGPESPEKIKEDVAERFELPGNKSAKANTLTLSFGYRFNIGK